MNTYPRPIRKDRFRFCPACAAPLTLRKLHEDDPERFVCTECNGVVYIDPKVVACVIVQIEGKILLMRRKRNGCDEKWMLPGGYVDEGEPVEIAAARELHEEAGIDVTLDGLVGVFSYPGWPPVIIVYCATADGLLVPGEETGALELFAPADIPWDKLAFPSTRDALRTYLNSSCQAAARPLSAR